MSISWFWFATGKNRSLKYLGPDGGATITTLMQAEAGTCYESPLNRVDWGCQTINKQTNKRVPDSVYYAMRLCDVICDVI